MKSDDESALYREAVLADYEMAEGQFSHFVQGAWDVLEPQTKLLWNWHHDLICEYLTAAERGEIRRLIINIAPRSTKSLLATVSFPDWIWTKTPSARFLFGSYAETLATKHSLLRRNLIESDWYQGGWGHKFKLAGDLNKKTEFANNKTGQMKSTGIKGSITGEGGDYIIIDDPHNPKGAESDADREATLQNFDLAWSNRLNNKKTGRIILIMQRLHHQDLTGHLIAKNLGYEVVKIPTVCERKTIVTFPISGKEIVREAGSFMHAERDGYEEIEQAKKDLGSYGFAGQHQQDPSPRSGGIIKRAWIKYYKELPDGLEEKIIVADLTYKDAKTSDFTVVEVWGRKGSSLYLIDQIRDRMGFPEQIQAIKTMSARHPDAIAKVIEEAANGAAVIQTLQGEIMGIVPFKPQTGKDARLAAVSPIYEAGNVYYPDPTIAPWVGTNVEEVVSFPNAAHDDTVDCASLAIMRLRETSSKRLEMLLKM
jgi:predicted phage terminase large subunit-like protein